MKRDKGKEKCDLIPIRLVKLKAKWINSNSFGSES